jgi:hypothetical protein
MIAALGTLTKRDGSINQCRKPSANNGCIFLKTAYHIAERAKLQNLKGTPPETGLQLSPVPTTMGVGPES